MHPSAVRENPGIAASIRTWSRIHVSTPTKTFNVLFKDTKQIKMLKDKFKTNEIILKNCKQEFVKIHKQH